MKIDFSANSGVFMAGSGTESNVKYSSAADGRNKTDVVEIAHGNSTAPEKGWFNLRASILRGIGTETGPERLAELAQSIREGTYCVPTGQLVEAILNP